MLDPGQDEPEQDPTLKKKPDQDLTYKNIIICQHSW